LRVGSSAGRASDF